MVMEFLHFLIHHFHAFLSNLYLVLSFLDVTVVLFSMLLLALDRHTLSFGGQEVS